MPREGFEPTIPVFERAKTVRALDCVPTVISIIRYTETNIIIRKISIYLKRLIVLLDRNFKLVVIIK
jgi:hypothetical protein